MNFLKPLQKLLLTYGVVLRRRYAWEEMPHRRAVLQRLLGVDMVVDVGANVGQYALELRERGYGGPIISLEPLQDAARQLEKLSAKDAAWSIIRAAAGDKPGKLVLHVTENSVSSSLLAPLGGGFSDRVNTRVAREEEVDVVTLDGLHARLGDGVKVHLKIDAQGAEDRVLAGARKLLEQVVLLEVEVSFVPLYQGQQDGFALLRGLVEDGWVPVSFNPECVDPDTMVGLQQDVMLVRKEALATLAV